jgi:alkylation response protein AidB-like acyl-CoA dehydrogenase
MTHVDFNASPALTAREQRFATLSSSLADELAASAVEHDRTGTFPLAHYQRLHETGYLRLAIPRDHGGEGANVFEMVLAQERLAQGDAATAVGVAMLLNVIGRLGEEPAWPEPVFAQVCRAIASEGGLVNSVVTEPDLGSISRGGVPATTATRVPGGWSISGHKIFVTAAPALRFLLTSVFLPPSEHAPRGEVARAIVETPAKGLRLESTWQDALSQRSGGSDDAYFDQVFVTNERVVERTAVGMAGPPPGANGWWLTLVAVYLGISQASLDAASDYANERVPSALGHPLAELPHVQQWIGQMQASVIAARAVLYDVARRWTDRPQDRPYLGAQIAAAKYVVTNSACRVTELGLRVAGGFSLTRRLTLERHFRDARGGLFQPPQDDLALGLVGRIALAARHQSKETP